MKQYATIVIIEDNVPDKGHYYHSVTPAEAIDLAEKRGCHRAEARCFNSHRHTSTRSEAVEIIQFGGKKK